jgi:alginate O-acetyltransferase complex protein AlgI
MRLGGLWHGASWNFIVWGGVHGGMLALERFLGPRAPARWLPRPISVPLTFLVLLCTWVFFRAENFQVAANYFRSLCGRAGTAETAWLLRAEVFATYNLFMLAVCAGIAFFLPNSQALLHDFRPWKVLASMLVFALAVALMFTQGFNPFLYFQF